MSAQCLGSERGNATLQVGVAALFVAMVVLGLIWGLAYRAAHHRVQGAADLVALAGAEELRRGGDACAKAKKTAAANEVTVTECQIAGDEIDYVVQVHVSGALAGFPISDVTTVHATATAGVLT